jgi:tetratricopeptide (TPR) repeat protein
VKIQLSCLLLACQLTTVCFVTCSPAHAYKPGDFPGQGKYVDWYDSCSYYHQGISLRRSEKYDQAIEQFKTAITHYGTDSRFFQELGTTYLDRGHGGDNEMALEAYRQATIVNESEWTTWLALADLYYKLGQKHDAKIEYRHALEGRPPTRSARAIQLRIEELDKESPGT